MVVCPGASSFAQALDWTAEVYRSAGRLMAEAGRLRGVADEGGFWPEFESNEQALEMLARAIEAAGYSRASRWRSRSTWRPLSWAGAGATGSASRGAS